MKKTKVYIEASDKKVLTKKRCISIRQRIINFLKSQGYYIKEVKRVKRLSGFEQDELLDAIRNYWIANPELRLCQLLSNIAREMKSSDLIDLFYIEDRDLLNYLKKKVGK